MAARILITMDDLSTAVPLNAAFEAAGFSTAMFSSLDDVRGSLRRENPELVILTGAIHEQHALQLAALARDAEVSTLALLEPTDSERAERVARLGPTETMMKPVSPDDAVATARRLIERRKLQERTGIFGESAPIQEVMVKIEQMAPVSSTVLIQGESADLRIARERRELERVRLVDAAGDDDQLGILPPEAPAHVVERGEHGGREAGRLERRVERHGGGQVVHGDQNAGCHAGETNRRASPGEASWARRALRQVRVSRNAPAIPPAAQMLINPRRASRRAIS
jgi:DNA-binding response OmpR family regulator